MEAPSSCPTQVEIRDAPGPAAAAPAARGGGGDRDALRQLIRLEDRRLQAAAFFLSWGCCMVIYGTELNSSANLEHVLVGYALLTIGAGIALLTLGGGGAGWAAARVEGFLRAFF